MGIEGTGSPLSPGVDALKVTKEEQKQLSEINKSRGALVKEITTKKLAILTDEQKEALKPKKKPTDK